VIRKSLVFFIALFSMVIFLNGCKSTNSGSGTETAVYSQSFKDYPDHSFNAKAYIKGMSKGGHGLLIWQDSSADLKKYPSIAVSEFGGRLLPVQGRFSYRPFIKNLNSVFNDNLGIKRGTPGQSLHIKGAMVECNPGNRAARILVGMGAGKSAGAIVCEVYEPGKTSPSIRIYARDTAAMSSADSISNLNNIFNQVSFRVAAVLEQRIGQ